MRAYWTSGKAAAGVGFAATAYIATNFYQMLLPEVQQGRWISPIAAVMGFIIGWRLMGNQVGTDLKSAARIGLGTSVWMFIWAVVLFASAEMVNRAMQRRTPDPGEAIGKVFEIIVDFTTTAMDFKVVATLVIGGMVAGVLAELANRRWH